MGNERKAGSSPRRVPRDRVAMAVCLAAPVVTFAGTAGAVDQERTGGGKLSAAFAQHGRGAAVLTAAHRAQWRSAPENSLPAIEAAILDGAEIIEIDVKRTKDGVLVLMHDDSVDRTTNGSGSVSDLTFSQVRELRLREGLGHSGTAVTDVKIPTLKEALLATKDRAMINLDKGWSYRDAMYDLAVSTGTVPTAIFKSTAPVAEVEAFRAKDPAIVYSHVVDDANASSMTAFGDNPPDAYELIFDRLTDAQIQPDVVAAASKTGRVWINTMWKGLAADYTDERSLIDPDDGWRAVTDRFSADIIQTDNVRELRRFLAGADVTGPGARSKSFRVQAEDYSLLGKNVGYSDTDDSNNGGAAARPYEGVDICDQQGAIAVATPVRANGFDTTSTFRARGPTGFPGASQPRARRERCGSTTETGR
ncbi:glycerophosphodiester phosphodiesterase family protein [Streptomyces sp. 21So2-11]|uniref:glycerophosphodiester phosphodiesterase family protein n=1 Tax=Streptomyces sp. 21So2-11 TaxID=3144408 RepID=UPI0032199B71